MLCSVMIICFVNVIIKNYNNKYESSTEEADYE